MMLLSVGFVLFPEGSATKFCAQVRGTIAAGQPNCSFSTLDADARTAVEATAKPASASLAMYRLLVTLVPTGPTCTPGKLAKPKPPYLALPSPSIVYKSQPKSDIAVLITR